MKATDLPQTDRVMRVSHLVPVKRALKDYAKLFLEHLPNDLTALEAAAEREDYDSVRFIAYRVRGGANRFGFYDAAWAVAKMEELAHQHQAQKIVVLTQRLGEFFKTIDLVVSDPDYDWSKNQDPFAF